MAMRTEAIDRSRGGMWPWLGQRVTAVLVIVTILIHLVLTHYVAIGQLSYDNIGERLAGAAVLVNDVVLLFAVVYHALNGLRMVVLDWGLSSSGGRRVFDVVLWVVGIAAVIFGIWALWVWVS
jgi:succinate dehydrogenase / fumarate reductase cytochrome b subunit